jgi:glyoxylase-like metal-dependent hydrolase (beta-lactamase superfamily II)
LIIDPHFTSFAPDIVVNDALDLAPWGIGGRAIPMPGHTPGSLVVLLDDGRAFVGDMMAGGYMGGAISPQRAGEHYFHADRARNLENIKTVLKQPVRLFYLGHGGPVDREAVIAGFATGSN